MTDFDKLGLVVFIFLLALLLSNVLLQRAERSMDEDDGESIYGEQDVLGLRKPGAKTPMPIFASKKVLLVLLAIFICLILLRSPILT